MRISDWSSDVCSSDLGTARFVTDLLRRAFTSSTRSKIGFLISRPATELLRHHLDPNNHNGAVFLGLNGVVLKSHGSADAKGVANCVHLCAELIEKDSRRQELGRASWRERVWQYVEISVDAV